MKYTLNKQYNSKTTIKFGHGVYFTVEDKLSLSTSFALRVGVSRKKIDNGDNIINDAFIGFDMEGAIQKEVKLELGIKKEISIWEKTMALVRPVQIAAFCVRIYMLLCIPVSLFFELNSVTSFKTKFEAVLPVVYKSTARMKLGGTCSLNFGCKREKPQFSYDPSVQFNGLEVKSNVTLSTSFVPQLTLKIPSPSLTSFPGSRAFKWFKKLLKIKPRKKKKNTDLSILHLAVKVPFDIALTVEPCSSKCAKEKEKKHEARLSYGFSQVQGTLSVEFSEMNKTIDLLSIKLNATSSKSACFGIPYTEKLCNSPTTSPPTSSPPSSPGTPSPTSPTDTPSPTPPSPCRCESGTNKVVTADGNCQCLPNCKDGRAPEYVGNTYKCPVQSPCGESPSCVTGRKGPSCMQLDVELCENGCSNGYTVRLPECQSTCTCYWRWTGPCCDVRLPARQFGDPHLETLDGIEFDYFGIGEFWGCLSTHNSFGMQFRYFAYNKASLTGGVVLKAGRSIVSVMTIKTDDPTDMPRLRLDGVLVNLTEQRESKITLDNNTVVLEIQKQLNSSDDKEAVMLLSLQYHTGVAVTIYVRHSGTMGRQFLNTLFTVNAAFKGHTQGLCGIMDNNPANDLTGPTGQLYTDPVQFADSWRISTTHNGSGVYDSWSWTSSNFHVDDVMDLSYTDPSHVPLYGLEGLSKDVIERSQNVCLARGLSGNLLKNCIYDVGVTNDTSLAGQEIMDIGCPNQCSGKGRCVNQTCQCIEGWSGTNCDIGSCPNCTKHGKCAKGFCQCDIGWDGEICDQKVTCYNVNNCTSLTHGVCKNTDTCQCNDGYIGSDCNVIPTCHNVSSCSNHGVCVNYDVCKCYRDWTGRNCTQYSCTELDHCSGHGRCVNVYECQCDSGWTGISCASPDCPDVNQCSKHGLCVSPNKCNCYPGYQGKYCSDIPDCSILANCSNHGACVSEEGKNASCRCYDGFSGTNCSEFNCNQLNNCSNHGVCEEAGLCKCNIGFTGLGCSNASCEVLNYCSGHGKCIGYDICKCQPLWHGAACSVPDCTGVADCSKVGVCLAPNKCDCYPGYDGIKCDKLATPNLHPPVFSSVVYNASVYEKATLGSFVVQVNASDIDTGRNGEVIYYLANDAGGLFVIEGNTGKIVSSSSLKYDKLKTDLVILDVTAFDNGNPMKFAYTKVYVRIIDVNDNCPIFDASVQSSHNISVYTNPGTIIANVTAVDNDNGPNGEVRYHMRYETANGHDIFAIDWVTGVISVANPVQPIVYHVIVTARDQGMPSCSSILKLTITGVEEVEEDTPEPTTGIPTTKAMIHSGIPTTKTTTKRKLPSTAQGTNPIPEMSESRLIENPLFISGCAVGAFITVVVIALISVKIRMNQRKKTLRKKQERDIKRSSHLARDNRVNPSDLQFSYDQQIQDLDANASSAMELHQISVTKLTNIDI